MKIETSDDESRAKIHRVVLYMHADISRLNIPFNGRSELRGLHINHSFHSDKLINTVLNVDESKVTFTVHLYRTLLTVLVIAVERL